MWRRCSTSFLYALESASSRSSELTSRLPCSMAFIRVCLERNQLEFDDLAISNSPNSEQIAVFCAAGKAGCPICSYSIPKQTLADQIDRLDGILDGLAEALNESIADAVKGVIAQAVRDAVQAAVAEVLADHDHARAGGEGCPVGSRGGRRGRDRLPPLRPGRGERHEAGAGIPRAGGPGPPRVDGEDVWREIQGAAAGVADGPGVSMPGPFSWDEQGVVGCTKKAADRTFASCVSRDYRSRSPVDSVNRRRPPDGRAVRTDWPVEVRYTGVTREGSGKGSTARAVPRRGRASGSFGGFGEKMWIKTLWCG